ncbi:MAG: ABC transporter ATP-binding protein [Pseudomonadota bacterium]
MALRLSDITHHFDRPHRRTKARGTTGDGRDSRSGGALDGVSLDVAAGEILTIFGPSGCGKTTLLRLVAGHEKLQHGSIALDGETLATADADVPPEERPVGFVFQDYVLFPHLTVAQNIRFGLRDLPMAEREARVQSQLDQLGIRRFANRFPHELSGGQQQRVAIARALARTPRVLLLDEPFASLGISLRQRLQAELRTILKESGVTVLFVTHDPDEAIMMGDRLALLNEGVLADIGTPQSLYDTPAALVSAALFPGRQKIRGRIDAHGVQTAFGTVKGNAPIRPALGRVWREALTTPGPAEIIISTDHLMPVTAQDGDFAVSECRFAAPHWRVFIAPAHTNDLDEPPLSFLSKTPFRPGERLDCNLAADGIIWIERTA